MATTRDTIATILNESLSLRALGVPVDNVFQADVLNSPEQLPFIVIRWGEEAPGLAKNTFRPCTLWIYDSFGDYNRAVAIGAEACRILSEIVQLKTDTGWILEIRDALRGGDLADEGFNALVVPYNLTAVASGL